MTSSRLGFADPDLSVGRAHNAIVRNSTSNRALANLPAWEELYAATGHISLAAGAAGDSVKATGDLETAAPSVDIARERVARSAEAARKCQPPPDPERASPLAATLDALDEFRRAERFDDWVRAWTRDGPPRCLRPRVFHRGWQ